MKITKKLVYTILTLSFLVILPSLTIAQDIVVPLPEDINNDGIVDVRDLVLVANAIGQTVDSSAEQNPDATGDGVVNVLDLVRVASRIGKVQIGLKKLYWGDIGTSRIERADPNGTNREVLVNNARPWDLALDIEERKIYWISVTGYGIERANLDGSDREKLVPVDGQGVSLDLDTGKMYWTSNAGTISRANLDGSNVELLIDGLVFPDSIALDLVNGKIYWTEALSRVRSGPNIGVDGAIKRANLDGSDVETLVTDLREPQGINLDIENGKMYWSNWTPIDKIQRANLDGTDVEDIAPGRGGLEGIVLFFEIGKMYFTDFGVRKILRSNFDGSDIEEIITTGLSTPISIVLDIGPVN